MKQLGASLGLCMVLLVAWDTALAKVKVVATLGDLAATARAVAGEHAEVVMLARPQQDPHFVDAKPSFVREVAQADLLVVNGMSLEVGWLPALLENASNARVQMGQIGYFDASTVIERKQVPGVRVTRAMGDVHPEGNPHYTYEPKQMARVGLALGKRLARIDPANASSYKKQARGFAREALLTFKRWRKKFASLPATRRDVVTHHAAWIYVLEWLDLRQVATVEPKPGVQPSPQRVAEVVEKMRQEDVPLILLMEYYPSRFAETLAEKTGAQVLTSQGQAREEQTYFERINALAKAIYKALKPA